MNYLSQGRVGPFETRARVIRYDDHCALTRVEVVNTGEQDRLMALAMNTGLSVESKRDKRPLQKNQGNQNHRIYELVRLIPPGRVATYGQIARYIDRCTPRMVGYAMAATPHGAKIPWHRVINSQGMISIRASGERDMLQQVILETEGVIFNENGKVDLAEVGWKGL